MNPSLQSDNSASSPLPYSEHLVPRGDFTIYARHYAATGPAFVLMHGFPHGMRNELQLSRKVAPERSLLHSRLRGGATSRIGFRSRGTGTVESKKLTEGKQLKATHLRVALEHAARGSIPQERDALWEAAKRLGISTDSNASDKSDQQRLLLAWSDLFRTGYLCWGYSLGDPNPPFYHVTERGRKALQTLSRDPANPEGYMAYLHAQGDLDPIAESYIREALRTYQMACYKAAAVLVGGATERLSLLVRDALVSMTEELGEAAPSLRKEDESAGYCAFHVTQHVV